MSFDQKQQAEIESALAHCNGSATWYKTIWPGLTITDGVKDMADLCGAYWLIDSIASSYFAYRKARPDLRQRLEEFCLAKLYVSEDEKGFRSAKLILALDTTATWEKAEVAEELLNFIEPKVETIIQTDFPLERMTIWLEGGVMLLPSEH